MTRTTIAIIAVTILLAVGTIALSYATAVDCSRRTGMSTLTCLMMIRR